jgi:hypothetical protein
MTDCTFLDALKLLPAWRSCEQTGKNLHVFKKEKSHGFYHDLKSLDNMPFSFSHILFYLSRRTLWLICQLSPLENSKYLADE